jgi:hypothetical protein
MEAWLQANQSVRYNYLNYFIKEAIPQETIIYYNIATMPHILVGSVSTICPWIEHLCTHIKIAISFSNVDKNKPLLHLV